jgi:hypothetical protein
MNTMKIPFSNPTARQAIFSKIPLIALAMIALSTICSIPVYLHGNEVPCREGSWFLYSELLFFICVALPILGIPAALVILAIDIYRSKKQREYYRMVFLVILMLLGGTAAGFSMVALKALLDHYMY